MDYGPRFPILRATGRNGLKKTWGGRGSEREEQQHKRGGQGFTGDGNEWDHHCWDSEGLQEGGDYSQPAQRQVIRECGRQKDLAAMGWSRRGDEIAGSPLCCSHARTFTLAAVVGPSEECTPTRIADTMKKPPGRPGTPASSSSNDSGGMRWAGFQEGRRQPSWG